ncbi:MAG: type II secretion system major pseudopilin GspG [Pirellulaceae bacterium]|nr:type II secretion system major pseudopilin GspG [Pirellulaceae bacterium]
MKHGNNRRGLTLLEVMIVLIILVGLMAVVGPRLLGTQKKADIRTAQLQIGNVVAALKLYAADMRSFPITEEGLEMLVKAPEDESLARNWSGPYLEDGKLPVDPWGSALQYEYAGADQLASDGADQDQASDFPLIFSMGPDRQPGTSDDISNRAVQDQEDAAAGNTGSAQATR